IDMPSILRLLANASKSRGVSAVIAPEAETQVRHFSPQTCGGPSTQTSNCMGSERASGAAFNRTPETNNKPAATAHPAAASRFIQNPLRPSAMPGSPLVSATWESSLPALLTLAMFYAGYANHGPNRVAPHLYADRLRSSAKRQRRKLSCAQRDVWQ